MAPAAADGDARSDRVIDGAVAGGLTTEGAAARGGGGSPIRGADDESGGDGGAGSRRATGDDVVVGGGVVERETGGAIAAGAAVAAELRAPGGELEAGGGELDALDARPTFEVCAGTPAGTDGAVDFAAGVFRAGGTGCGGFAVTGDVVTCGGVAGGAGGVARCVLAVAAGGGPVTAADGEGGMVCAGATPVPGGLAGSVPAEGRIVPDGVAEDGDR